MLWIENIENGNEWDIAVGVAAKSPNKIRFMIMIIMMANIEWIWYRCRYDAGAVAGEWFKFLKQIVATFRSNVVKHKTQWISVRINFRLFIAKCNHRQANDQGTWTAFPWNIMLKFRLKMSIHLRKIFIIIIANGDYELIAVIWRRMINRICDSYLEWINNNNHNSLDQLTIRRQFWPIDWCASRSKWKLSLMKIRWHM